jgi:hypothetical protein
MLYTGPPREFALPKANLPWGPHDIIIFKVDPTKPWLDCMWRYCKWPSISKMLFIEPTQF